MRKLFLVLLGIFVFSVTVGCDRMSGIVGPEAIGDEAMSPTLQREVVVAASATYTVSNELRWDAVDVHNVTNDNMWTIGGPNSSPIIGLGIGVPKMFVGDDHRYIEGSLESDIVGTNFGATIAIHEGREIPMVGTAAALVAVGAPDVDGGRGAVYVFRVGSRGVWFEAKIEAPEWVEPGDRFSAIHFSDGYLSINCRNGAGGVSIPLSQFLTIG